MPTVMEAKKMLQQAYDPSRGEFTKNVVVYRATSPSKDNFLRVMGFKLCPGGKGCPK